MAQLKPSYSSGETLDERVILNQPKAANTGELAGESQTAYDRVPYPNYVHSQTHPNRLAAIAALFGMKAAPVDRCRILELGCGQGANLIPIANAFPETGCVGIDLSSLQIGQGNEVVDAVGLSNIELKALSILDLPEDLGEFDYIICHGVYSWVPAEVRDKILAICKQHLSPNGVAIISYNTFPGWHQRRMIRDMMRFHTKAFEEPKKRVEQARAFLTLMTKAIPAESAYGKSLHEEFRALSGADDSYLFHEQLEDINEPQYFHQFAASLEQHGLQYLNEVNLNNLSLDGYPPEVAKVLADMPLTEREQYVDFLVRRTFRQSIICRDDVVLDRTKLNQNIDDLFLACPAVTDPESGPIDLTPGTQVSFVGLRQTKITVNDPTCKAALGLLAKAWPQPIKFTDLDVASRKAVAGNGIVLSNRDSMQQDSARLAQHMLRSLIAGAVSVQVATNTFTVAVADRPTACPLARAQTQFGNRVATRLFQTTNLNPLNQFLVGQLDGNRTHDQLLDLLVGFVEESEFVMQHQGQPVTETQAIRELIGQQLKPNLEILARKGLLVK